MSLVAPVRAATGETSAPLPQMEGIAINLRAGQLYLRKTLTWSIKVPPPATINVSASAGSASVPEIACIASSCSTRAQTEGEAIKYAFAIPADFSSARSQRRAHCSCCCKTDPFPLEDLDDVLHAGDPDGLVGSEVVSECLVDTGSNSH